MFWPHKPYENSFCVSRLSLQIKKIAVIFWQLYIIFHLIQRKLAEYLLRSYPGFGNGYSVTSGRNVNKVEHNTM